MSRTLNFRKILLILGDILLLYVSLGIMVFFGFWKYFSWEVFLEHLFPFTILYIFWLIVFYIFGLYELNLIKSKLAFYPRLLGAISVNLALGMIFFYLVPFFKITPKTNLFLNALIFGILFLGWRNFFYSLFSSYFQNRIAILGEESLVRELSQEIVNRPYLGYKLVGILKENEDFFSKIQEEKIDTLIIAKTLEPESEITKKLYQCLPLKINLMDFATAYEIICDKIPISFVRETWFLENLREGEKGFYNKIKRVIDIVLATLILLGSLPLWPFIILAIKLEDGGPIFYSQKRIGKARIPFTLAKFRSMKKEAEKKGAVWAEKEDSRITKVGKFLRQTHLDELPQMFNIIKGDISLVGPRPERPKFVKELEKRIPHYHLRHLIKPGFTGWAQIKFRYGRSIMDSHEKFQYDLYYIKNRSLILDIGILLKTFQLFFKKE